MVDIIEENIIFENQKIHCVKDNSSTCLPADKEAFVMFSTRNNVAVLTFTQDQTSLAGMISPLSNKKAPD